MKKIILALLLVVSSLAQAQVVPAACVEKVSYDIIRFLEKEEPSADLHLLKDEAGNVVGLTDSEDVYADYELTSFESLKNNRASVVFHSGDVIVFAEVFLGTKTKPNCRVTAIDMGQDDQD